VTFVKGTHVVVVLEVLQILIFVLSQSLSHIGVLNHVQNRLSLLLQSLVCQKRLFSLLVEIYATKS
jgi:hypothetical protein